MTHPADDDEKTPVETPDAKKSSGTWVFNLGATKCAREDCGHAREEHVMDDSRRVHECMAFGCLCHEFFVGG